MLPLVAPAEVRRGWKRQYPGRVGSGFSDYKRGAPVHGLGETTAEDFPESFYTGDDIIAEIQHPEKKKVKFFHQLFFENLIDENG